MLELRTCVLLVLTTGSYLTLAIFNPPLAESLWAIYAAVTFVLSVVSWYCDHHKHKHRRR